jgi:hypothetical protein
MGIVKEVKAVRAEVPLFSLGSIARVISPVSLLFSN